MKNFRQFSFLYLPLITLIGLFSCKEPAASKTNTAEKHYTVDDFSSVKKFDVHIHLNTDQSTFIEQAKADNFHFLDIVDDRPFGVPMKEQQRIAILQLKNFSGQMDFATTFTLSDWGGSPTGSFYLPTMTSSCQSMES